MPVNLKIPEFLEPVLGVRYAAIASGVKKTGALDLVAIELAEQSHVAAVFTQNKFCAAPVIIAKQYLSENNPRYLLVNSGNANAGTGKQGLIDAINCCQSVAQQTGCDTNQVLPFSTGVIATALPVGKIQHAIPQLIQNLSADKGLDAAKGILTTDLALKAISKKIDIDGEVITITGFTKGSGMIKPNMATMLAYVFTDASISKERLQALLKQAVAQSFNAISVDGDTSTNDACVLVSTQHSKQDVGDNPKFIKALNSLFIGLAQNIIRDGEGSTKFITIHVQNAYSEQEAKDVAFTIAHSPLVKTALFASDPNWGRILAAVGRAPIEHLDINKVDLFLADECLVQEGLPFEGYSEARAFDIMAKQEITITVNLNIGSHNTTIWTSDLSYDYVKINAEYRS